MRSRRCSPSTQRAASTTARSCGLFTSCSPSPGVSESPRRSRTCLHWRPRDRMADLVRDELAGSADRFGYEWDSYAEILPGHEEQFRRWTAPLSPQDWQDKEFLDVGWGLGGDRPRCAGEVRRKKFFWLSAAAWGGTVFGRYNTAQPAALRSMSTSVRWR